MPHLTVADYQGNGSGIPVKNIIQGRNRFDSCLLTCVESPVKQLQRSALPAQEHTEYSACSGFSSPFDFQNPLPHNLCFQPATVFLVAMICRFKLVRHTRSSSIKSSAPTPLRTNAFPQSKNSGKRENHVSLWFPLCPYCVIPQQ